MAKGRSMGRLRKKTEISFGDIAVLKSAVALDNNMFRTATTSAIVKRLDNFGISCKYSVVYARLSFLERHGYLESTLSKTLPKKGGRRLKIYCGTLKALTVLQKLKDL